MNRKHGLLFALLLNLTACGGGTQTNDGGATARQKQGAIVVVQSAYAQVDAGTIYAGYAIAHRRHPCLTRLASSRR